MPRVLDVVEYPEVDPRELVHRVPETGPGDLRIGTQLIVREGQSAVFFKDGKALDVFRPGRYTVNTRNIPLLVNLVGAVFSGSTPFTAEVFFVNTRQILDMKWGTPQAVLLRDQELGMVRLRAFGAYSLQIISPRLFVGNITGARGLYHTTEISDFLRGIIASRLTDLLGTSLTTILDLPQNFDELSDALKDRVKNDFTNLGVEVRGMYIEAISPTEDIQKALDERAAMGAVGDLQAYMQFKASQALSEAAQHGGEGGSMGLVAGLGLGGALMGAMGRALGTPGVPAEAAPAPAPAVLPAGAITCASCQTENPAGARFCLGCGARLETTTLCSSCQAVLAPGARFCTNCGTRTG